GRPVDLDHVRLRGVLGHPTLEDDAQGVGVDHPAVTPHARQMGGVDPRGLAHRGGQPGLLVHLTHHGVARVLAVLDTPARQRPHLLGRDPFGHPREQDLVAAVGERASDDRVGRDPLVARVEGGVHGTKPRSRPHPPTSYGGRMPSAAPVPASVRPHTPRPRDPWVDNAKAVLVVLVVVGHFIPLLPRNDAAGHVYDFLYLWHMPAFVLVSGWMSRRASWSRQHLTQLVTLFVVPYLV